MATGVGWPNDRAIGFPQRLPRRCRRDRKPGSGGTPGCFRRPLPCGSPDSAAQGGGWGGGWRACSKGRSGPCAFLSGDRPFSVLLAPTSADVVFLSRVDRGALPGTMKIPSATVVDRYLCRLYAMLGRSVERRPLAFVLVPILVVAGLGIGLIKLEFITQPEDLWVARSAQVFKDEQYFDDAFGSFFRVNQFILTSQVPGGDVITMDIMTNVLPALQFAIENYTTSGRRWTFQDNFCYQPLHDGTCSVQTPLTWYTTYCNDPSQSGCESDGDYQRQAFSCTKPTTNDCFLPDGITQDYKNVLGRWTIDSVEDEVHAEAIIITYLLLGNTDDVYVTEALDWEQNFLNVLADFSGNSDDYRVSYMAQRSIADEIAREQSSSYPVVILSYTLMFLYVSLSLGRIHPLKNRILIALCGILVVAMSLVGAVGLLALCGVKASLVISEVIPFLILAIGVDNIFIITHRFDVTKGSLEATLAAVGSSITLSSMAEFVAFMLGAFTQMPAVQSLCLFAGTAVLFDWILQLTVYSSLLLLMSGSGHQKNKSTALRTLGSVLWLVTLVPVAVSTVVYVARLVIRAVSSPVSLDELDDEPPEVVFLDLFADPADKDLSRFVAQKRRLFDNPELSFSLFPPVFNHPFPGGFLRPLFNKFYAPAIVSRWWIKGLVLLGAVALLAVSMNGFTYLQMGLDQKDALPNDSYLIRYFDDENTYLAIGPPVYLVVKEPHLEDPANQVAYRSLVDTFSGLEYAQGFTSVIPGFHAWYSLNVQYLDGKTPVPSANFTSYLRQFLNTSCTTAEPDGTLEYSSCGVIFVDNIKFNEKTGDIDAIRSMGFASPLRTQSDYIRSYLEAYAASADADSQFPGNFPYSIYYVYFAQYGFIAEVALTITGVSLAAVLVVCILLLGSIHAALLTVLVVLIINIDLWGLMALWGVDVNAVSVVNTVMAVGISVEFCSHISRAFLFAPGSGTQRAVYALREMGSSVFTGISLTKFAGVIPLAFAPSQLFVIYYFRMFMLLVLLGAFHGLAVLPVLLAVAGPQSRSIATEAAVVIAVSSGGNGRNRRGTKEVTAVSGRSGAINGNGLIGSNSGSLDVSGDRRYASWSTMHDAASYDEFGSRPGGGSGPGPADDGVNERTSLIHRQ